RAHGRARGRGAALEPLVRGAGMDPRRPPRPDLLSHGIRERLAADVREHVVDDAARHRRTRLDGVAPDVRGEDDVREIEQLWWHVGLVREDVEAGADAPGD